MVISPGGRFLSPLRGVQRPRNHDSDLVVPQRDAGQEAARTLHARIGADSRQVGRTVANMKRSNQDMWIWVASDATTKIVPVIQVGGRTQEAAYQVVHELKGRLRTGCVPVFSTFDLKNYFYALTAHFGMWERLDGKKPIWVLLPEFIYAQVIKQQKRRRTVDVERRILIGDGENYQVIESGWSKRTN